MLQLPIQGHDICLDCTYTYVDEPKRITDFLAGLVAFRLFSEPPHACWIGRSSP